MIGINGGLREKLIASLLGGGAIDVSECDYLNAERFGGGEMILRNAAATDEADLVALRLAWFGRQVIELRRPHGNYFRSFCGRFVFALSAAVSTICWPMRLNATESGPMTGSPVSRQWRKYCTGFCRGRLSVSTLMILPSGCLAVCTRIVGS